MMLKNTFGAQQGNQRARRTNTPPRTHDRCNSTKRKAFTNQFSNWKVPFHLTAPLGLKEATQAGVGIIKLQTSPLESCTRYTG